MENEQKTTENAVDNNKGSKLAYGGLAKLKPIYKIFILVTVGVGVALGCCDIDCLLFNFNSLLGL